jgi:hypothetical protein
MREHRCRQERIERGEKIGDDGNAPAVGDQKYRAGERKGNQRGKAC